MFLKKTNNKFILESFSILAEIIIGFSTFAVFFGIFMTVYFTEFETTLLGKFIKKSVSFYTSYGNNDKTKKELIKKASSSDQMQNLRSDSAEMDKKIKDYNYDYDMKLIYIIIGMILGLMFILIIPVLLGIIRLEQINFKYLGISLISHIGLIVGFELIFLLIVLTYINPVKLYRVFQTNKENTGHYI